MPQKRNHDLMGRYPNIKVGTCEPMRIKDILRVEPFIYNYDRLRFFAKFYAIISLKRLPNQCPKKEIMILRKDILI